jgi:hypothetical protein
LAGSGVLLVRAVDDGDFLRFGEFDGVHDCRKYFTAETQRSQRVAEEK